MPRQNNSKQLQQARRNAHLAGKMTNSGRTLDVRTFGLKQKEFGRSFQEINHDLKHCLNSSMVMQKQGNDYISWYNVAEILDRLAPGWYFTIDQHKVVGPVTHPEYQKRNSNVVMPEVQMWYQQVFITLYIPDGPDGNYVVRPGYGQEPFDRFGGDEVSICVSQALRKAAALGGLGRPLWFRDEEQDFSAHAVDESKEVDYDQLRLSVDATVQQWMDSEDREGIYKFLNAATANIKRWKNPAEEEKALKLLEPLSERMAQMKEVKA